MSALTSPRPTDLDVPHVARLPDVTRPCIACEATGPHGAVDVPGDAATEARDHFTYFACAACGTLQIAEIPADLGRYYGSGYYSFRGGAAAGGLRQKLTAARNRYAATGRGLLGRLLSKRMPYPLLAMIRPMIDGRIGQRRDRNVRLLDVGCGAGRLLRDLQTAGLSNLTGIDPYLGTEVREPGFRLIRGKIDEIEEQFDLITFNHSLEHVTDPCATLAAARRRLAPGGVISIRIPLVEGEAWKTYGGEWGQLDAPRHLYLFTRDGFARMARRAGMALRLVAFDSDESQFVLSELRLRGVRFHEVDVKAVAAEAFSLAERGAFRQRAAALNAAEKGDQAAFFLQAE